MFYNVCFNYAPIFENKISTEKRRNCQTPVELPHLHQANVMTSQKGIRLTSQKEIRLTSPRPMTSPRLTKSPRATTSPRATRCNCLAMESELTQLRLVFYY